MKPMIVPSSRSAAPDAPSRGHDLKQLYIGKDESGKRMPPHGGMT